MNWLLILAWAAVCVVVIAWLYLSAASLLGERKGRRR